MGEHLRLPIIAFDHLCISVPRQGREEFFAHCLTGCGGFQLSLGSGLILERTGIYNLEILLPAFGSSTHLSHVLQALQRRDGFSTNIMQQPKSRVAS